MPDIIFNQFLGSNLLTLLGSKISNATFLSIFSAGTFLSFQSLVPSQNSMKFVSTTISNLTPILSETGNQLLNFIGKLVTMVGGPQYALGIVAIASISTVAIYIYYHWDRRHEMSWKDYAKMASYSLLASIAFLTFGAFGKQAVEAYLANSNNNSQNLPQQNVEQVEAKSIPEQTSQTSQEQKSGNEGNVDATQEEIHTESKEAPVEVGKEVSTEVKKEVPVEVGKEVSTEVKKEVPVEVGKEVSMEVKKEVPVEVSKESRKHEQKILKLKLKNTKAELKLAEVANAIVNAKTNFNISEANLKNSEINSSKLGGKDGKTQIGNFEVSNNVVDKVVGGAVNVADGAASIATKAVTSVAGGAANVATKVITSVGVTNSIGALALIGVAGAAYYNREKISGLFNSTSGGDSGKDIPSEPKPVKKKQVRKIENKNSGKSEIEIKNSGRSEIKKDSNQQSQTTKSDNNSAHEQQLPKAVEGVENMKKPEQPNLEVPTNVNITKEQNQQNLDAIKKSLAWSGVGRSLGYVNYTPFVDPKILKSYTDGAHKAEHNYKPDGSKSDEKLKDITVEISL